MTACDGEADPGLAALGKRQRGVEERRRRLVKAASELIAERDDGSFSMPELARRAGLSLATPYNLFGSKAAVLTRVFERLVRGFHRDPDWMTGLPASDRILGVIDRLARAYEDQGRLFRNLWKALYGLDLTEHRQLSVSLSSEIVHPLVVSLAGDGLLPDDVPHSVIETALVRLFDANFEMWAAQDWPVERLRANLRTGFALVFLGLLPRSERDRLAEAIRADAPALA
jgi:AcrR family transcriptional regulator